MTVVSERPEGRSMPHPLEAKNPDGSIDLQKAAAGMMQAGALFLNGDYTLIDLDELVVDTESEITALNSLGSNGKIGDEVLIIRRRKA